MTLAPGKLVLAGEYAVLVPGGEALVLAVGPGIAAVARGSFGDGTVCLRLADGSEVHGEWRGHTLRWSTDAPSSLFVRVALEVLAKSAGRFALELEVSEASWPGAAGGGKPGLGGSAAATVVTVAEVSRALGLELSEAESFALAFEAHRLAQGGRGSGVDVAASALGGCVSVRSRAGAPPDLTPLAWSADYALLPVFTGQSTSTVSRISRFNALWRRRPDWVHGWVSQSNQAVQAARLALDAGDWAGVVDAIGPCRGLLLELGEEAGIEMEEAGLRQLVEVVGDTAVVKQSGAGGADTGIVLARDATQLGGLTAALRDAGLWPLSVEQGARLRMVAQTG